MLQFAQAVNLEQERLEHFSHTLHLQVVLIVGNLGDSLALALIRQLHITIEDVLLYFIHLLFFGDFEFDDLVGHDSHFFHGKGLRLGPWESLNNPMPALFLAFNNSFFDNIDYDVVWDYKMKINW